MGSPPHNTQNHFAFLLLSFSSFFLFFFLWKGGGLKDRNNNAFLFRSFFERDSLRNSEKNLSLYSSQKLLPPSPSLLLVRRGSRAMQYSSPSPSSPSPSPSPSLLPLLPFLFSSFFVLSLIALEGR